MTNKNYISGRAFEYRVKREFEAMGFLMVRSAGSKSPIDLMGLNRRKGLMVVIQCKHRKLSKPAKARLQKELEEKVGQQHTR